ncbi:MAG: hypothetical protein QXD77_03295 [Candidatus Aenigmatarchaeota archaeon]
MGDFADYLAWKLKKANRPGSLLYLSKLLCLMLMMASSFLRQLLMFCLGLALYLYVEARSDMASGRYRHELREEYRRKASGTEKAGAEEGKNGRTND